MNCMRMASVNCSTKAFLMLLCFHRRAASEKECPSLRAAPQNVRHAANITLSSSTGVVCATASQSCNESIMLIGTASACDACVDGSP